MLAQGVCADSVAGDEMGTAMSDKIESSEVKAAKKLSYDRGYQAGKRRKKLLISREQVYRERQAFLDRVFIALLPTAMTAQDWKFGSVPITSGVDRVRLAKAWAKDALFHRPKP